MEYTYIFNNNICTPSISITKQYMMVFIGNMVWWINKFQDLYLGWFEHVLPASLIILTTNVHGICSAYIKRVHVLNKQHRTKGRDGSKSIVFRASYSIYEKYCRSVSYAYWVANTISIFMHVYEDGINPPDGIL